MKAETMFNSDNYAAVLLLCVHTSSSLFTLEQLMVLIIRDDLLSDQLDGGVSVK